MAAMDAEETIKFLLGNQARMAEHQQRMDAQLQSLAGYLERVARVQAEMVERESRRDEAISGLVVIVGELASQHRELELSTTRRFRELEERVKETTETLNVLIKTVDDLIRRRNGGADPPKP